MGVTTCNLNAQMGGQLALGRGRLIPGWARRFIAIMLEFFSPSNSAVPSRWIHNPQFESSDEVCIFVSYAPDGAMPEHSRFHALAWATSGFKVVVVLNTNTSLADPPEQDFSFASGLMVRENRGYDFGAWSTALMQMPALRNSSLVALVNDSMYGPLKTFDRMIERVRSSDADVIGASESGEFGRHFQSFLLCAKPGALKSNAFWKFWENIRAGGRVVAVYRYELGFLRAMERAGLRCKALFSSPDKRNPTLTRWRELIEDGFPYLKIALLRDNLFDSDLSGWEDLLRRGGFDPSLARAHSPRR
jgi:lipopolysaccharide biosynthesis protein